MSVNQVSDLTGHRFHWFMSEPIVVYSSGISPSSVIDFLEEVGLGWIWGQIGFAWVKICL